MSSVIQMPYNPDSLMCLCERCKCVHIADDGKFHRYCIDCICNRAGCKNPKSESGDVNYCSDHSCEHGHASFTTQDNGYCRICFCNICRKIKSSKFSMVHECSCGKMVKAYLVIGRSFVQPHTVDISSQLSN